MTDSSDKVSFNPSEAAAAPAEPTPAAAAPAEAAAGSTTSSAASEKPKAVFVENLNPTVTTKMLNEFFSLCGTIESITVRPKPNAEDGTLEAIVFFESSAAADTAVLLTNAILVDRSISITYFKGADVKDSEGNGAAGAAAAGGEEESPSVWATILAAGYKIVDGIQNAAMEVDQKYGVRKGFEDTMDKIDQSLGLSTKAAAFSNAVHQKSEELHVTEKIDAMSAKMTEAGEAIGRTANEMFDSAMQNEYVSSAWSTLSGWGSAIVSGWLAVTDEANALYTKQTGIDRNAPPAAAAATATPDGSAAAAAPAPADADTVSVPKQAEQPAADSSDEVKIPADSNAEGEKPAQ